MAKHPKESSPQSVDENSEKIEAVKHLDPPPMPDWIKDSLTPSMSRLLTDEAAMQQTGNASVAQQYPQGRLVEPLERHNAIGAAPGSLSGLQAAPRRPSIGRIVIFTDNYRPTERRAAIVAAVQSDELVDLVVFDTAQNPPTSVFKGVPFSAINERGTWNWPAIV